MRNNNIIYILILVSIFLFLYSFKKNNIENLLNYNDKGNINVCYSNVMSKKEENILYQLINIWNKVSNEMNIKWSVCAGTYIGLIRDGGRIAWDDDFDLTIMEKDLYKMKNIDKILSKYNVSISKFWGGYKIFFNDHRAINKFSYGWNWPFIDIFASNKEKNCYFLNENEFPLEKKNFDKVPVFVFQNPSKNRDVIKKNEWRNELLDTGYRHQIERKIRIKCLPKKI